MAPWRREYRAADEPGKLNSRDLSRMSTRDPRSKGRADAEGGPTPAPQWDIPDLIDEPPRAAAPPRPGAPEASSAPALRTLDNEAGQIRSFGLIEPDEEAQASVELELDLPPSLAADSAGAGLTGNGEPANSGSGASAANAEPSSALESGLAARQPRGAAVDPQLAPPQPTVGALDDAQGAPARPRQARRRVAAPPAHSPKPQGYVLAASLLAAALLVRLGSCAYSAVSGEETRTGWLAGLLLVGATVLFARGWWLASHRA
jgi:hypothetical protein